MGDLNILVVSVEIRSASVPEAALHGGDSPGDPLVHLSPGAFPACLIQMDQAEVLCMKLSGRGLPLQVADLLLVRLGLCQPQDRQVIG
jgi:hypothetical protein